MTAKITVERISAQAAWVTLVADIQISGNLATFAPHEAAWKAAGPGSSDIAPAADGGAQEHEPLTVEETAEILHIGRDKTYSLIRTGQLRSIKIGKLRRISRAWITDFVCGRSVKGSRRPATGAAVAAPALRSRQPLRRVTGAPG